MRLGEKDLHFIKAKIRENIKDAKIYIFGSMLQDDKKGGDIDIFIVSEEKVDFKTKSTIKYVLEDQFLRPVDLVFHKDFNRPIEQEALKGIAI